MNKKVTKKSTEDTKVDSSQFKLSLSEFAMSLDGAKQLTAAAMRVEYKGLKMTKSQWVEKYNKFSSREVK